MNIWIMAIICGICSTMLVNPYFVFRFFKGVVACIKKHGQHKGKKKEAKTNEVQSEVCFDFGIMDVTRFWIIQDAFFASETLITAGMIALCTSVRTLIGMTGYFWIVAILHGINAYFTWFYIDRSSNASMQANSIVAVLVILVIWGVPGVHSWIYNPLHPVDDIHTYLEEKQVPVLSADVLKSLEKECILEGYSLKEPLVRQGKVVYPLTRSENVAIAGYIAIEDGKPIFVEQELPFNPYQITKNHPAFVFRKHLPTKVGFSSEWSFQLDPEGQVWFAGMYGDYTCLKAGRHIEGIALVNGSTGEFASYDLEEIPAWITGISE